MSKSKPSKKKVVVSTNAATKSSKKPAQPRTSKSKALPARELTFGRETYIWIGLGFVLLVIGMALMTGGKMPSADVWDDDLIYSTRRTVVAPVLILAGLIIEVYAVFNK